MPTDNYLHKWVWLTKEAGLCYDVLLHIHIVTLSTLARDPMIICKVRPG